MTIFSAYPSGSRSKLVSFVTNGAKVGNMRSIMTMLPFEYTHNNAAAEVAADMITQHDFDSINRGEDKFHRSTISMIPASSLPDELRNDCLKHADNHQLSDITYFGVRLFICEDEEVYPCFGTITFIDGNMAFKKDVIEQNTLAYEHMQANPQMNKEIN